MMLSLTVLSSPVPQPRGTFRLEAGRAVLGREEECDWRIEDPAMFVSRRHCVIEATGQGWTITDTSSGGLFLDMAPEPLGQGRSAALQDGMRLRLGDVVIAVELANPESPEQRARQDSGIGLDPFFAPHEAPAPPPPRPADLPEPFERITGAFRPGPAVPPPGFDDPFMLDPVPPTHEAAGESLLSNGDAWAWGPSVPPEPEARNSPPAAPAPAPAPTLTAPAVTPAEAAAAFRRGAGLDASEGETLDFEALGRSYRMLTEGLVALLRSRAEEKSALRLAHTTLGATQVNPLKFLAMPEERIAALIAQRGPGYLSPEAAIAEAFRDLADHRMRSWQGLQAALRRMIDRFSPEAIEAELTDAGLLQSLLAGGRSAQLWKAYRDRWAEIARAAEDRFLGEAGAEFREAYEAPDRREP